MRFRNSRLRTKIAALLLSLTALWVFAAWVTLREGVNLLWVSTYDSKLASPSDPLLVELQRERRLTAVWIAQPTQARQQELTTQRTRTDKAAAELEEGARSGALRRAADDDLERRVGELLGQLHKLDAQRKTVDARSITRPAALQGYTTTIDSVFRMYDAMGTLDDKRIAKDTGILIELNRSWELLSQEDALVAGVLATGHVKQDEMRQIVQLAGIRRYALSKALTQLQHEDDAAYLRFTTSTRLERLEAVENRLTTPRAGRAARIPAISAADWESTTTPALAEMRDTVQDAGARLIDRSTPVAAGVIIRLVLAGGLGLLAVIASVIVSITTARALVRQLERLRGAAWELAEQRLPSVVERLGHGEKVDVALEAPPLQFGSDEIGQVGRAFNAVQETAIRTAVEQAELRRGIRDVLLSLARRTQALVHRQLSMLDTMERKRDIDPKDLEELFRLDHLATRMRRNAENLIVLSGSIPARGWRQPVPMVDVIRAAVGEVEDYTRVTVLPFAPVELAGRAVGDITHLLAELIENAVSFSPPDTAVHIGGHLVANGFAIDVEDRGLGMTDEKLAEINARIVDPPEFNLRSSVQLGLFVVAKLAERYDVRVSLKRSAYGGTTAVIVIPQELVVEDGAAKAPAATTENGLAVRQPTPAPAGAEPGTGAQGTRGVATLTRPQSVAPPALVAVPTPAPDADDAAAPRPAGAETGTGPQSTGPHPGGPASGPATTGPTTTGPTTTGPITTGPQAAPTDESAAPEPPGEPAAAGGPAAADGVESATSPPEVQPPVTESITPSGLPVRVPQANLAAPLRTDEPAVAEEPDEHDDPGRSPEEIQRIMGSYQRGTRLARTAVETRGNEAVEGEDEQ